MHHFNANIVKTSLQQHHLFSKLTPSQLEDVYKSSQVYTIDEAQTLFNQSDEVISFFMLLTGKIKLFRLSSDGQEKIIEIINDGEVFAEALMFTDHSDYPVSATALTKSVVISLNAKQFKNMLQSSNETCLLLLGFMSYRLRMLVNEIDTLTLHTGTYRVACYFMDKVTENEERFKLGMAKNVIAARLSIKPETFSRILKNLKNKGILSIDGNYVTVHDINALKQYSLI
jgi:CRP-like cAMP-binding protein